MQRRREAQRPDEPPRKTRVRYEARRGRAHALLQSDHGPIFSRPRHNEINAFTMDLDVEDAGSLNGSSAKQRGNSNNNFLYREPAALDHVNAFGDGEGAVVAGDVAVVALGNVAAHVRKALFIAFGLLLQEATMGAFLKGSGQINP